MHLNYVYQKVITTSIRSMKCSLRQNGNTPSKKTET